MTTVLELITDKLFQEVAEEHKRLGQLSDGLLSALNCIFGQPLVSAVDLFDRNAVKRLISPTGKDIYKVSSNSGSVYTCPASLQYCPCMSFAFGVMRRGELLMCKHILAIHLCKACDSCEDVEVTEEEFSTILAQQSR